METPEKRGTPAQGNNLKDKLIGDYREAEELSVLLERYVEKGWICEDSYDRIRVKIEKKIALLEKLREKLGYYHQKEQLAQVGSEEETFWNGNCNGLAIAIEIVEGEQ